jgi:hypothetical protein
MRSLTRRVPFIAILIPLALAGALTAGFLAFTHGSTARPALLANSTHKGLPDSAYHNTWTSYPNPPLPTSGPPNICGPWSAANSAQVQAIQPTHGRLDSCLLVDHYWLVTTENVAGHAQIGILNCSPTDSTCMNGWQAKDLRTFAWHTAPPSVTQLKIMLVDGHLLTMITNYGQWTFDIDTATFARMRA